MLCVQYGKIYTRQNVFTQAPPVVPVTNMRYGPVQKTPCKSFEKCPPTL